MDSGGLAIGRGAGLRVEQLAELRAGAEIPALLGHEVDSGGVREATLRRASLVTLLHVNAGAVGKPRLHARDQVAPAADLDQLIVVRPFVFQRIVQVKSGPIGIEKAGANLSAGTQISVGRLTIDLEAFRQAIGAAQADAAVVGTAVGCRDRVLGEGISAPRVAGTELYLRDGVRALALLLGQWNNRRIILPHIIAHARTEAPSVGQLVGQIQFHRPRRESLVLGLLIALGYQAQAARHRHFHQAAELLGVLDRHLSRRRVTGADFLVIERETTVVTLKEVAEPDTQVGAVGISF